MSQPILLNELNKRSELELHMFNGRLEDISSLDFEFENYVHKVEEATIAGKKALWISQHYLRKSWRSYLREKLNDSFDLVIGMNEIATPAIDIAQEYDIPSLFFIRNLEVSGQEMYDADSRHISNIIQSDFGGKVQYPFLAKNFREYRRGMEEAEMVVANSEYVSGRLKDDFGVDSEIIYPPIRIEKYKTADGHSKYISMVNPRNEEKGGDIFLDIVEGIPSKEFLSAGVFRDSGLEKRAEELDNLTHLGWCDDMKELYKKSEVVLVPSRGNEAFGRVAAEAMVNGIPCVVSNRGGLPEVVGDTGEIVEEIESVEAWEKGMQKAIENHQPGAQKKRAQRFSADKQGEEFMRVVNSVVS